MGCQGRKARRWQLAAGLIYGQAKKSDRRRKLVKVSHVMRLGTETALKVARPRMGLSGRLNTAFIDRVDLTVRHGVAAALVHRTWATAKARPTTLGPSRVVACVLSSCTAPYIVTDGARAALRTRRQTSGTTLPAAHSSYGNGKNQPSLDTREVLCHPLSPVPCLTI